MAQKFNAFAYYVCRPKHVIQWSIFYYFSYMYAMCRGIVTFETPNLFSGSKARTFRGLGTGAQNQVKNFSGGVWIFSGRPHFISWKCLDLF